MDSKCRVSRWIRSRERVHLADHLNLLKLELVANTDSGLPLTGGCLNAQASFHLHWGQNLQMVSEEEATFEGGR